jgi:hypothetical protein
MSIEIQRKKNLHMIRLESALFMESDEDIVKQTVEQALAAGVKNFIFSVSIASSFQQAVVSRLLVWCREKVRPDNGQLLFFENDTGQGCAFGTLCESLQIPMYYHRYKIKTKIDRGSAAMAGPAAC